MRVLQVIDSVARNGGAEQALAAMAPHLVAAGIGLDIAYLTDRDGLQEELAEAGATLFGVHRATRIARVRALQKLIQDRRPDLVHTSLFEADIAGRIAAGRTPVVSSLVNASYGPEHLHAPGLRPWKVRSAQLLDAVTARRVVRFHALTEHVAETMATRLRVPRTRIDVVPRGRDPIRLAEAGALRAKTRAALGIADDTRMVLVAARQEHQKGLDVLVEAFMEVRRQVPKVQLIAAGRPGAQTPKLQAMDNTAVQFLGARADVPELMGAADVFVLPSRYEGLGSVLIEAMGVGVPIVASDLPPVRETLQEGVFVPPQDTKALAAAIVTALTDRDDALKQAAVARERFFGTYTIGQVTDRMVEFYEQALKKP